jgi:Ribbon-helix-helix protein, copG family
MWCSDLAAEKLMPVDREKTVRTSVIVPADLYQRVQQLAASNDVSAAWIVRHALIEFLAGHGGEQAIPLKLGETGSRPSGGRGQILLLPRPRSADRTRSPAPVSRKREYFKYPPETIGDFAPAAANLGARRPIANSQKPAIGGHF